MLQSLFCLIFLVIVSLIPQSQSIIIYYDNKIETYTSYYTTLGIPPSYNLQASIVILSRHNFSKDCWFSHETNTTYLKGTLFTLLFHYILITINMLGKIVVLEDEPEWAECVSDNLGTKVGLGRIMQKIGVAGVLLQQLEWV